MLHLHGRHAGDRLAHLGERPEAHLAPVLGEGVADGGQAGGAGQDELPGGRDADVEGGGEVGQGQVVGGHEAGAGAAEEFLGGRAGWVRADQGRRRRGEPERAAQPGVGADGGEPAPGLDLADRRPADAALPGQAHLGPAEELAAPADLSGDLGGRIGSPCRHHDGRIGLAPSGITSISRDGFGACQAFNGNPPGPQHSPTAPMEECRPSPSSASLAAWARSISCPVAHAAAKVESSSCVRAVVRYSSKTA